MRLAFAGLLGAFIGLIQLFVIAAIESRGSGPSGVHASDAMYPVWAFLVFSEIVGVIALSMYRVAPWILRVLRADWEVRKVLEGRARNRGWIGRSVIVCTMLRRALVMIDAGTWSFDLMLSLAVALACLLVPLPVEEPIKAPQQQRP
jgi:hypothetical protein